MIISAVVSVEEGWFEADVEKRERSTRVYVV